MRRHFQALIVVAGFAAGAAAAADAPRAAQAASNSPSFAALDVNNDGKLSLNEASVHDELFVAFKKLDTDRDGELTKAEFAVYSAGH